MSNLVYVAATVIVIMFAGAAAYIVANGVTYTSTSTATVTTTTSTVVVTTTTQCTSTITGNLGNYRGEYPNGTYWISIDGHYYTGDKIINGTTPTTFPPNGEVNHWWIVESC